MQLDTFKIQCFMGEHGQTQAALAETAGMTRQNLNAILRRGTCSTINAGRIARALGVDISEICVRG